MFPLINKRENGVNLCRIMDKRGVTAKDVQQYLGLKCVQIPQGYVIATVGYDEKDAIEDRLASVMIKEIKDEEIEPYM